MQKFGSYQRENGTFYWIERGSSNRGSLGTKNREEAEKLLNAKNEAHRQPILNLALGRAYLSAHDPRLTAEHGKTDEMAWRKAAGELRCIWLLKRAKPLRLHSPTELPFGQDIEAGSFIPTFVRNHSQIRDD